MFNFNDSSGKAASSLPGWIRYWAILHFSKLSTTELQGIVISREHVAEFSAPPIFKTRKASDLHPGSASALKRLDQILANG